MAKATPKATQCLLVLLTVCSTVDLVLRYSTYLHLITSDEPSDLGEPSTPHGPAGAPAPPVPSIQELYVPLLTLVPNHTSLLAHPWTVLTTSFVESGLLTFAATFAVLLYTGRYIETLWGAREFVVYVLVAVVGSNMAAFCVFSGGASASEPGSVVLVTGASNIVVALLVAIKQRIPAHYLLFLDGNIRLKVALVPFMLLSFNTVLAVAWGRAHHEYRATCVASWAAFALSWTYLRFWKDGGSGRQLALLPMSIDELDHSSFLTASSDPVRGDRTPQFALHTFFPKPLSLVVRVASDLVFKALVRLRLVNGHNFVPSSPAEDPVGAPRETTAQGDLINQMSKSWLLTSSSLAGVSGNVSVSPVLDRLLGLVTQGRRGASARPDTAATETVGERRQKALLTLDSRLQQAV